MITKPRKYDPRMLTDEFFWDDFWLTTAVPARPDPRQPFSRSFSRLLDRYLHKDANKKLIEIGCAPGRWLVHCHERYAFEVCGYEFSDGGASITRENLAECGVSGRVFQENFLTADLPQAQFDVVLSLGFIEHFERPDEVMARHAQLVRPGGLLFLEVPNFQGINLAVLRWSRSPLLAVHNLQVMSRPALRALALAAGMEIVELGYLGGYETQFFDLSHRTVWLRAPLSLAGRARRIGWLDRVNAPWLSGYLFGVFRKSG